MSLPPSPAPPGAGGPGAPSAQRLVALVAVVALVVAGVLCAGPRAAQGALPRFQAPVPPRSAVPGATLSGPLSAPGGPFLTDRFGRVVVLHGVNAVYKRPPYQLYPDAGRPWNFTAHDAATMAALGFNVVRLGMTWSGLEPGTAGPNSPGVCRPGPPGEPHQWRAKVMARYLQHLHATVNLLARYHIYTLLDMHQDVYNQAFDGEGAPDWAVCTNNVAPSDPPGRWSRNYATAGADIAYGHFWNNDVVGNLQGNYDRVWAAVAASFRNDPWVVGYDPFNEPFSRSLVTSGDEQFDRQLECFYTGWRFIEPPAHGAPGISCPPQVPAAGVIPRILAADPHHLVFYEPNIFSSRGRTNFVGPMNFPNLVFNIHIYCGQRSPKTGNPTNVAACAHHEARALRIRAQNRTELSSPAQQGGPAWFVSEFGATSSVALLDRLSAAMDHHLVGWTYWSWKYYGDPTGSSKEALVTSSGRLRRTVEVLARTYPEAIAGVPRHYSFRPATGAFDLVYTPLHQVHAPTLVVVPTSVHYAGGYCAVVRGAKVLSKKNASLLEVANVAGAQRVQITVHAGSCPTHPPHPHPRRVLRRAR